MANILPFSVFFCLLCIFWPVVAVFFPTASQTIFYGIKPWVQQLSRVYWAHSSQKILGKEWHKDLFQGSDLLQVFSTAIFRVCVSRRPACSVSNCFSIMRKGNLRFRTHTASFLAFSLYPESLQPALQLCLFLCLFVLCYKIVTSRRAWISFHQSSSPFTQYKLCCHHPLLPRIIPVLESGGQRNKGSFKL